MTILESITLGLAQGLTEFIPVSSSGHLELIPKFANWITSQFVADNKYMWQEPSTGFVTFLHFGTLLALVIFYRKTLWDLVKSLLQISAKQKTDKGNSSLQLVKNIAIATIPAGILGFALSKFIENIYDTSENAQVATLFTALAMIIVGIAFIFSNKLFTSKKFSIEKLTTRNALIIGFAQALALFRGTSRSGITLLAGQAIGLNRVSAAEFGFLMSIPITLAAALFGTIDLIKTDGADISNNLAAYLVGLVTSFVFGYLAISFMLNFLKKKGLRDFGIYRIIIGLLALLLLI